jgi:hypothetical protein
MNGWFKFYRKIVDSRVFSDPHALKMWVWLLAKANRTTGYFEGEEIAPGQLATSLKSISNALKIPKSTADRTLKKLEKWNNIATKSEHRFTVVTICNWKTYQSRKKKRGTKSERSPNADETQEKRKRDADETQVGLIQEGKEFKRREEKEEEVDTSTETDKPSAVVVAIEPPVLEFPCDGNPKTWGLVESQVADWSKAYPSLDVLGECRKALAWVNATPEHKKTARGMSKFLVNWFSRTQNRGSSNGNNTPQNGSTHQRDNSRRNGEPSL